VAVSDKEDEKGLWLVAKSGQKYLLANAKPAKDEEQPVDHVAKLEEARAAGNAKAKVAGYVTEKDGVATLELMHAESVTEEKK
jgi:hypothetical protein